MNKNPIPRVKAFYEETKQEVKKCSWPTRDELIETTMVVLIGVVILAAWIYVADICMQWFIKQLI